MPTAHDLLGTDPITYHAATESEDNVLARLVADFETKKLFQILWNQRRSIEALTSYHLGLGRQSTCTVLRQDSWIRGSFNICIPVQVKDAKTSMKVLMRCPMPHKLAEARYPGTVEEKIRCEAGTYAWVQDYCPEIPIPHLFGFGLPDGHHFTHSKHRPFYSRIIRVLRRFLYVLFQHPVLSYYTRTTIPHRLDTGYMLLEFIEPSEGQILSSTWQDHETDSVRLNNLFRGMARVMLALARIPQPRIGSFRFHNDGTITLTNRPLTSSTMILESEGAPRVMQSKNTYGCTESFVSDTLTFHDNRFLNQPNAVYDEEDCRGQMAVKALLRTISHHFIDKKFRYGPYLLQYTDFHNSNIIVDNQWHLKRLIDLEWVSSLPREMLAVPYWVTGRGIDQIQGAHLDEFDKVRQQFMDIFREEETLITTGDKDSISLTKFMHSMWETKGVWFWFCLDSVNGMYRLLEDHICPKFSPELSLETERIMSCFWRQGSADIIAKKLGDKERYDQELRCLFDKGAIQENLAVPCSTAHPDG